jgi:ATP-dependent DNA helicase RecQ
LIFLIFFFHRGEEFRKDFQRIGQHLLPLIPDTRLTATAPPTAQKFLQTQLQMDNPTLISENPDRPNIFYRRIQRPPSQQTADHLDCVVTALATELKDQRLNFQQTIVYSDTDTIAYSYWLTERLMGPEQYEGEEIPENRLFAQYHQVATPKMKEHVIAELCKEESKCHLVFATVALGMGLDAPHIRQVIHYKPPTSLERYFQETGRAGRDQAPAVATMYFNNTDIRSNRPGMTQSMIEFCKTDECLRAFMLSYMGHKVCNHGNNAHSCCSNCCPQ